MLLMNMVFGGAVSIASSWTFAADSPSAAIRDQTSEILDATGDQGGLIVHLGCGDGRLTAAHAKDDYIVQGLETDEGQVNAARKLFASFQADGKVTAEWSDGQYLPYLDNLVREPAMTCRS